jgi:hypothetical protein
MSSSQPATADSGYITEPVPLENTYTSDPSLQRALSCEFQFLWLIESLLSSFQGICHLVLYKVYNRISLSSVPRLSPSGSVNGVVMRSEMSHM